MKKSRMFFFLTTFFYLALFININNKTFFAFFFVYLIMAYLSNKNFREAILLTYIASLPFPIGKTYTIELIPATKLNLPLYPYGIVTSLGITVQEILIVVMILLLVRDAYVNKKSTITINNHSLLLASFFFSLLLASWLGSIRPDISLFQSLYYVKPVILYWYITYLRANSENFKGKTLAVLAASVILQFALAMLQFIRQSPLGTSIESSMESLPIDLSLEAIMTTFRPVGTFAHANLLAHYLLPYGSIFLPFIFLRTSKFGQLYSVIFWIWCITILTTLSRSSWLSFLISLLTFLFIVEKVWKHRLKINDAIQKVLLTSLPIAAPLLIFILIPRIVTTLSSFEMYGSGYTRLELAKEAITTISRFPFFGIGLGMDTFYSYTHAIEKGNSIYSYFPEAVHNGFLQLMVQVGILPMVIFLLYTTAIVKTGIQSIHRQWFIRKKIVLLSILLGISSIYINAMFQPLFPGLQDIVLLSTIFLQDKTHSHDLTPNNNI